MERRRLGTVEGAPFSIREAFRFGWGVARRNTGFFAVIFIASGLVDGIPGAIQDATAETQPFISFVFGLITLVVSTVTSIGQTKIALRFADGERPTHADLYAHYRLFFRFLFTIVVYLLVGFLGLVLFIVPGAIWLVRYSMSLYLVVDRGMGTREALRESATITRGARWQLFRFGVTTVLLVGGAFAVVLASAGVLASLGLINIWALGWPLAVLLLIVGLVIVVVGLLRLVAMVMVAGAHVYRRLSRPEQPGAPTLPVMKWE